MKKIEISALLASVLVRDSKKLQKMYPSFSSENALSVAEILMKPTNLVSGHIFIESISKISKYTNQKISYLALKTFQKELTFEKLVKFYADETRLLKTFTDTYEVRRFFCKQSGCDLKMLSQSISGALISRPLLVDLVDAMEYLTGRSLLSDQNQPLQYLDAEGITYKEIADYFSIGCAKIDEIRERIFNIRPITLDDRVFRFQTRVAVVYAQMTGKEVDETFFNLKVKELRSVELENEPDWRLPIHWTEDEVGVLVAHLLDSHLTDNSTVGNLIELFCNEYFKSQVAAIFAQATGREVNKTFFERGIQVFDNFEEKVQWTEEKTQRRVAHLLTEESTVRDFINLICEA